MPDEWRTSIVSQIVSAQFSQHADEPTHAAYKPRDPVARDPQARDLGPQFGTIRRGSASGRLAGGTGGGTPRGVPSQPCRLQPHPAAGAASSPAASDARPQR